LIQIDSLRKLCKDECIAITKHARTRLVERNIFIKDIVNAIKTGEIIKQYEDDKPFPSCLLLGQNVEKEYIHIVASIDNETLYIITAYYPNENDWEPDLKTRRER